MNIQNRKNRIIHSGKGVKLADHGRILTLLGLIVVSVMWPIFSMMSKISTGGMGGMGM